MASSMALNGHKSLIGGPARPPTFPSAGFGQVTKNTSNIARGSVMMMASKNVHEIAVGAEW